MSELLIWLVVILFAILIIIELMTFLKGECE